MDWHIKNGQYLKMKKPLVLVHGWGMNPRVWEMILPDLEKKYDLHLLSLPGHGDDYQNTDISPNLADWSAELLAKAPPKAYWLGWSLGGDVVLQACLDAPERILKAFIMTGSPCFLQKEDWSSAIVPQNLMQFSHALFKTPNKTLERFLLLQIRNSENEKKIYSSLKAAFEKQPEPNINALKIGLELLRDIDLRPALKALKVPTYWLFGEKDTLIPATCAQALINLVPQYQSQVIANAGHAPFLSHPQQTLQAIQDFLADVR